VSRRRVVLLAVAAVAAGGAGLAGIVVEVPRRPAAASGLDQAVATATVTRQTLADQDQVNGTIGYAGSYSVINQYSPPPSAATIAQAQHQVDAARQSLADTQASIDLSNRQDNAAIAADRAQLQSDQSQLTTDQQKLTQAQAKSSADGCGSQSATPACQADATAVQQASQAVAADQQSVAKDTNQLNQDLAKHEANDVANQAKLHQAQQSVTSAEDSYNQKMQPGGSSGSSGSGGGSSGAYTWLPGTGQVIGRGQKLYAINGRPIPLLIGTTPLTRQLTTGVSGDDVRELEDNLVQLGYGAGLTADGTFTSADADAVKRWQAALGVDQTGVVNPGEAVFLASPLRVSQVKVQSGASSQTGQNVIDGTGPDHVVTVNLDARRQTLAHVGADVDVSLPTGSRVQGKIVDVGTVATTSGQGANQTTTIPVSVTLADQAAAGKLDGASVSVYMTRATHPNVLTVPVTALMALSGGGYAVETADGRHRRIPVQTGLFSNGRVEVSGPGIVEGLKILAPTV
jgi:putative peptidoglycan binding protein